MQSPPTHPTDDASHAPTHVLVAGATGGVGQLVVANLLETLEAHYRVRVLVRDRAKAERLFGDRVEIVLGNLCHPDTLPAAVDKIDVIIAATGTTAFPSQRWQLQQPEVKANNALFGGIKLWFDANYRDRMAQNGPRQVDTDGINHLLQAAPQSLKRFVFVSSCGVLRKTQFPFNLLNSFGVLDAKAAGEAVIRDSGLPYTIIRPARLIDGPYTAYDFNTLVKAKTHGKFGVTLGTGDTLNGQTSRIDLAAACVACLTTANTINKTFEIINRGIRPKQIDWQQLLSRLP